MVIVPRGSKMKSIFFKSHKVLTLYCRHTNNHHRLLRHGGSTHRYVQSTNIH